MKAYNQYRFLRRRESGMAREQRQNVKPRQIEHVVRAINHIETREQFARLSR
jgi:hypothetical protein